MPRANPVIALWRCAAHVLGDQSGGTPTDFSIEAPFHHPNETLSRVRWFSFSGVLILVARKCQMSIPD